MKNIFSDNKYSFFEHNWKDYEDDFYINLINIVIAIPKSIVEVRHRMNASVYVPKSDNFDVKDEDTFELVNIDEYRANMDGFYFPHRNGEMVAFKDYDWKYIDGLFTHAFVENKNIYDKIDKYFKSNLPKLFTSKYEYEWEENRKKYSNLFCVDFNSNSKCFISNEDDFLLIPLPELEFDEIKIFSKIIGKKNIDLFFASRPFDEIQKYRPNFFTEYGKNYKIYHMTDDEFYKPIIVNESKMILLKEVSSLDKFKKIQIYRYENLVFKKTFLAYNSDNFIIEFWMHCDKENSSELLELVGSFDESDFFNIEPF